MRVAITCIPKCSVIKIAGKKVKRDKDGSFRLPPGKHGIVLFRAGYRAKKINIDLQAGEPYEKKVPLVLIRRPKPPRSCGQFLNPCR